LSFGRSPLFSIPSGYNSDLLLIKEDIYYYDTEVNKMKKRKMFSYFLIITMSLFYFYACGDEEQPESQPQATPQKIQEPDTVQKPVEKIQKEETAARKEPISTVPETYIVEQGETLTSIAEKFYGDSQKWFYIFALNESDIDDWNKIYGGQSLKMPMFDETTDM
jgi:hypothetical protein